MIPEQDASQEPATHDKPTYHKVEIIGTLVNCTPLHIGSGKLVKQQTTRKSRPGEDKKDKAFIASIALDHENKPFIPGSSLKGLLRSVAFSHNQALAQTLMGRAKTAENKDSENTQAESESQGFIASRITVYDAFLASATSESGGIKPAQIALEQRMGIAIDPLLGVAKEGALFGQQLVPAGHGFSVEILLRDVSTDELATCLGWLAVFDGSNNSQLGGGANHQFGRLQWQGDLAIKKIGTSHLTHWLTNTANELLPKDAATHTPTAALNNPGQITIGFQLQPTAPLLCGDREWGSDDSGATDISWLRDANPPAKGQKNLETNGKHRAIIPAATLLGWLRGRCRKILMTWLINADTGDTLLSFQQQNNLVDRALATLFGSTDQAGLIAFTDALTPEPIDTATQQHTQMFNAIDRFTGAVAKGALYKVESIVNTSFTGEMVIRNRDKLQNCPWAALLGYALRDAFEGDIRLGWGKNKGYGDCLLYQISISEATYNNWNELFESEKFSECFAGLKKLGKALEELLLEDEKHKNS